MTFDIEMAKLAVSVLVFGGALVPAAMAVRTYKRNDVWKRAEFLAREMKEFFGEPKVQNAFTLIDWGTRSVALLGPEAPKVRVTRSMQVHALLPHTLMAEGIGSDAEDGARAAATAHAGYAPPEVAIRDCYDAFLDGLERFSSYAQTRLIGARELLPYLRYWIDDIHGPSQDAEDAAWSAALLTYIQFYRYGGVQWLFSELDRPIDPGSPAYAGFLQAMADQTLATKLAEAARKSGQPAHASDAAE